MSAATVPVGPVLEKQLRSGRKQALEGETMSEEHREENDDFNEDGPGINGDIGSWLYVLGGIPLMIIFFVVLFTLVGSCDAKNIMLHG